RRAQVHLPRRRRRRDREHVRRDRRRLREHHHRTGGADRDVSVRHPLSEDQQLLVDAVRTLARERIAPMAADIDKRAEFPWPAVELLREHDVFALCFPEQHGGTGTGTLTFLRAVEELSWADATVGLILAVQSLGAAAIELAGSEQQKDRYLPRWASGEWISAYALTEAGSGSAAPAREETPR